MKILSLLLSVVSVIGFTQNASANPATIDELNAVVGHYVGGDPSWMNNAQQNVCSVDIAITAQGQVSVVLKDQRGIPLYSRPTNNDQFATTILPEVSHPLLKLKTLIRRFSSIGH